MAQPKPQKLIDIFHQALEDFDVEKIKECISLNVPVNRRNYNRLTALHICCEKGNVELVKLLLEKKALINSQTPSFLTPLHIAIQNSHLPIVQVLLEKKASTRRTKSNESIHFLGAKSNNFELFHYLVKTIPTVEFDLEDNNNNNLLLHAACSGSKLFKYVYNMFVESFNGDETKMTSLLKKSNKQRNTCLHLAIIHHQDPELVAFLVEKGLDINQPGENDLSPLYLACSTGKVELVDILLENNASLNAKVSPLLAAVVQGSADIVEKLLKVDGCDINTSFGPNAPSLLHVAASCGFVDIVKLLLSCKEINFRIFNAQNRSPFFEAIIGGHIEVVKQFLDPKFKVDREYLCMRDSFGRSPVDIAVSLNNIPMVELLINEFGLDDSPKHLPSPLQIACRFNYFDLIDQLLIDSVSAVDSLGKPNQAPLFETMKNPDTRIFALLLDNGANPNIEFSPQIKLIHYLISQNHFDKVKLAINHSNNMEFTFDPDSNFLEPVMEAARLGKWEIVRLLLQMGSPSDRIHKTGKYALIHYCCLLDDNLDSFCSTVNLLDPKCFSIPTEDTKELAIHLLAKHHKFEHLQYLVEEYDLEINTPTILGMTIGLLIARHKVHDEPKVLKFFQWANKKGIDLNAKSSHHVTIAHFACLRNNLSLVEFLIENKVDMDARDNELNSPLHLAVVAKANTIIVKLLEHGVNPLVMNVAASNNSLSGVKNHTPLSLADEVGLDLEIRNLISKKAIEAQKAEKEAYFKQDESTVDLDENITDLIKEEPHQPPVKSQTESGDSKPSIPTNPSLDGKSPTPVEILSKDLVCQNCKAVKPNLAMCGRCESVYYCSRTCQEADWPNHRRPCRKIVKKRSKKKS